MSKERLEFDAEREMIHLKKIVNKDDSLTLSSRFVKYLIEQSERAGYLERVLEFYADEDNYKPFGDIMRGQIVVLINQDKGIKARQALEDDSNE